MGSVHCRPPSTEKESISNAKLNWDGLSSYQTTLGGNTCSISCSISSSCCVGQRLCFFTRLNESKSLTCASYPSLLQEQVCTDAGRCHVLLRKVKSRSQGTLDAGTRGASDCASMAAFSLGWSGLGGAVVFVDRSCVIDARPPRIIYCVDVVPKAGPRLESGNRQQQLFTCMRGGWRMASD
ncbi:hypothetical protein Mp_1g17080 [Marchantia polymorpha subsp. ruderalis]|uniref:Uncharacterized protein n=2 Tax=Marchantia polymorpha TaxID=3197 RepID=A0AAF6AR34_MARPO|nr:hypothetical protein MARPO_0001s0048 [Marchantia polymorpha]BBM98904.1 hypothetical protein Mp_1g17080 [Marchantia polymorpha subsp. ruderalis]|eukprot:PTQ49980.1 hypothetical protein MARPO_0001s0048 [Marchantia polymorpha]